MTAQWVREKLHLVETEIAAGRAWRAKEMLQGAISSKSYVLEPDLLEAYGALLDSLGDRFEAGKYLFLSGKRSLQYEEAISLYLQRTRRTHVNDMIAGFPAALRHHGLGHLPDSVRQELARRGAEEQSISRREPLPYGVREETWKEWLAVAGIIGVFISIVAVFFVGLGTILGWLL